LEIPTIMGISSLLNGVRTGQMVALDGATGRVWLRPNRTLQARLMRLRTQERRAEVSERATAQLPAILQDGKVIGVSANINSVPEATEAVASGADGVGLFRTEFLYVGRATPPDEEEQFATYSGAAQALAGRPLVIRTLDLGGDKVPSYLAWPVEANPALGWRGIRYWLARPEIARPQLRAILRAGAHHPVKLLLPFVTGLNEVEQTQEMIAALQAELGQAGLPYAAKPELGVMIETPAAVLLAPQFAAQVDFFSIGTNDLTQFVMAADRNNLQVAALADGRQPAVLRMIQQTVQAAHQAGVRVTVCGELAADPHVAVLLVGLGVDELSMNVPAIPMVKAMLRKTTLAQSIALAEAVLALTSAGEVVSYLRRTLAG
jgi:multiphosphoryl transfer protein